jgi:catecholate siderophore receptor
MGAALASAAMMGKLTKPVEARGAAGGQDAAGGVSMPAPAPAVERIQFDIPPGPLDDVLAAYRRATGIALTVSGNLSRGLTSPGVSGLLSAAQALTRLLEGTSLSSRFTARDTAIVELRARSESVQVTGTAAPIVSSSKYTAPLREIPQSIEVIPRALMEQQGATSLTDALRNVPGISLQAGEGGGASNTAGDMFNMRGFSANNSLFVDGVRDDGLVSRDVFNLEQVEVFLGPTGSDVGRGTAAGYVNMATKTPHVGSGYDASFGYGGADQKRLTVDVNHGLSNRSTGGWRDHAAVRFNALWNEGGVVGRDVVTLKRQAVAPSLALGLGTATRVTIGAQINRQDDVPDYGVPGAAWRGAALAPTTVVAAAPVDMDNFYGSAGYDRDKVSQESYTARVERDVDSRVSLRNQTRYNRTHRTAVISTVQSPSRFDPVTETLEIARQGNERENEILSNQTSLDARFSTGGARHAASAGLEFTADRQFAPALTGLGTRGPVDIYAPNPFDPIAGYDPVRSGAFTRGRTSTAAVYAFDSVDLGRRWQVSGGARWEHYDTTFRNVDATGTPTVDEAASDSLVSGKAGLLYRLGRGANVYASFGTALTPPGTANFTLSAQPNNQNNPNVKPQQSTNYEVGAKWGMADDRLLFTAAVFHTRNENVIYTVDASAVPPVFNQDDGQRVDGATIGVAGRLTERWDVTASVGYLSTELETQNPANAGHELTLTPPVTGSVWTTYRVPAGFTLGGGVRYMDAVFVNTANTIRVPGYRVADALVEYAVNTHLTLRLNLTNVAGAVYIRNVNNNGARFNPGAPRAAMLTSRVAF